MELVQDSKTKPAILESKDEHNTRNLKVDVIPRKCAEVFQCDRGGLTYICLFCGEDFAKALQLEEHLLEHFAKFALILDTKSHCCDIKESDSHKEHIESLDVAGQLEAVEQNEEDLGAFIKTETIFTEHIIEEDATIKETWFKEVIKCEHCIEAFNCQGLRNLHNRQKHSISFPHNCQQCNATFNEADKFKRHKELHGILNNPTCDHCQQIFEFQSDLDEHLQQTDDATTEVHSERTVNPQRPYSCNLCGKTFARSYYYLIHIKESHNTEYFYCDICPYKVKVKTSLIKHMRIHTKERPYGCEICGKKFPQQSYIKVHRRIHTGEKPYQCNICGLTLYTLSKLNNHVKEKHSNAPRKEYPCNVCNKKCCSTTHLKNHMRTHTGEKPFKCAVCNFKCTLKSTLTVHGKIHESINAYACKYCDAKFAQSAAKSRHERRVHEGL